MIASLGARGFGWSGAAINGDGAGLGAAVEADAAAGTVVAGVTGRMDAVGVQVRFQFQALGWTGIDAKTASFALVEVDRYFASCRACHSHLTAAFCERSGRCSHLVFSQYA